jgi:3-oxoacyl-[acyl-carrier protein] reductase
METGLKGMVVLITGASGGIGSAVASKFAEEGVRLVLHYRNNRSATERLERELNQ